MPVEGPLYPGDPQTSGPISNTASVARDEDDPTPDNDTSTVSALAIYPVATLGPNRVALLVLLFAVSEVVVIRSRLG